MRPYVERVAIAPLSENTMGREQSLLTRAFIERVDGREFLQYRTLFLASDILRAEIIDVLVNLTWSGPECADELPRWKRQTPEVPLA